MGLSSYSDESEWYRARAMGWSPMGQTRQPFDGIREKIGFVEPRGNPSTGNPAREESSFVAHREEGLIDFGDIRSISYDNSALRIRFKSPRPDYVYYDVPSAVYRDLMGASNVEQYYRQNIRSGGYRYDIII